MLRLLISCVVAVALLGCETESKTTDASAKSSDKSTTKNALIRIESVKVVASQSTLRMEGTPKPKAVEEMLLKELYAQPTFDEGGTLKARVKATYDVRRIESANDTSLDAVFFGDLTVLEVEDPVRLKAEVRQGNAHGEKPLPVDQLVEAVLKEFVSEVGAQARVENATEEELIEFIGDKTSAAARRMAVQEVRERRTTKAAPAIRMILAEPSPKELKGRSPVVDLKVSASAALVALGDSESYSDIIKFAEERSRMRDPQMIALIYVIGQMKTDESMTYLETLSTAHEAPPVREAATRAMKSRGQMP